MEIASLVGESRTAAGTRAARRLRKDGKIPAIIYGHGQTPEDVAISQRDFGNLLTRGAHVVELALGSSKHQLLIKAVQYDHLGLAPIHADFMRVDLSERVTVSVPLEFRGTPAGVLEGGLLEHDLSSLSVKCTVTEIPVSIRVNVANLKIGEFIHVRDLELPAGIEAVTAGETIVASVKAKIAEEELAAATAGEEGATGPEIIGRKEKEEEGDEEKK